MKKPAIVLFAGLLTGCGAESITFDGSETGPGGGETVGEGGGGSSTGTTGGGGSGSGGESQGGGGEGGGSLCTPGEVSCNGDTLQTCNDSGTDWDEETCPYLCEAGACTGECSPGSSQCDGLDVQTCDGDAQWQATSTCPFVCDQGACTGVCEPNDTKCDGLTPQTCDSSGQWVNGSPCQFVCTAGACTGSCTPNDTICNGNTVQTCDQNGQWQNTQSCPYVCQSGSCTGVCSPGATQCAGNTVETCDANGQWQSGAACPFVCSAGACTGVCVPGSTQCDGQTGTQTCNSSGQWSSTVACPVEANEDPTCSNGVCGTTCQTGYDDCTGAPGCESDLSDPATCGSCSNQCSSTGGTATCSMGTCGIVCDSQHDDCVNGAADGCETDLGTTSDCLSCGDSCTSPNNATGVCTQQGCDFVCTGLWDDCNGLPGDGCEHDVSSDPWNCGGCGISCHGGSCTNGVCEWPITKVADVTDASAVTSMALGTPYATGEVYWTESDGDIQKAAATGSSPTLLASGHNDPAAITTDGVKAIWSDTTVPKSIEAVPVQGGAVQPLVTGHGPVELTHDGFDLFWTSETAYTPCYCSTFSNTDIWKMAITGGVPTVINPETNSRSWPSWPGVEVDATVAYRLQWISSNAGTYLKWVNKTDSQQYGNVAGGITIDGNFNGFTSGQHLTKTPDGHLVFSTVLTIEGPAIIAVRYLPTLDPVVVVAFVSQVEDVAADDTHVYVLRKTEGPWREIRRYPIGGGGLYETMANYQFNAKHLKIDATHVYWVTEGYKFANPNPSVPDVADPVILRVEK